MMMIVIVVVDVALAVVAEESASPSKRATVTVVTAAVSPINLYTRRTHATLSSASYCLTSSGSLCQKQEKTGLLPGLYCKKKNTPDQKKSQPDQQKSNL